MKAFSTILALAATARTANAHATVWALWVNGVDQGTGNSAAGYIRSPPNNNPITDVTSDSMACNVNNAATAKTIKVAAGDEVTIEWHHDARSASDDIIASSHVGPVMTYLAPTSSDGAGDVWVKIQEEGYDTAAQKWAVDNLIANQGKYTVIIPDIAAGEYLLRSEIIALHEANRAAGAQFYMECAQIEVTSAGKTALPAGVAIPGTYKATDPGVLFNVYSSGGTPYPKSEYTIPGPAVWDGASGSAPAEPESPAEPEPEPTSAPAPEPVTSAPVAVPTVVVPPTPTTLATYVRTSSIPAPSGVVGGGAIQRYSRCGGIGYEGETGCAEGLMCKEWNDWYFQCIDPEDA